MYKEVTIKRKTYVFVEVPDDSYEFDIRTIGVTMDKSGYKYLIYKPIRKLIKIGKESEDFQILFTTKDIAKEQVESIIPKKQTLSGIIYPHYPLLNDHSGYYNEEHWASICNTAKESLQSLIQSLGLDLSENHLIIEKL